MDTYTMESDSDGSALRDVALLQDRVVETLEGFGRVYLPYEIRKRLAKEEARYKALLMELHQAKAQNSNAVQKARMIQRAARLEERLYAMQALAEVVPRPIDLSHLPNTDSIDRPHGGIWLGAIPDPSTWDSVWTDRIRALNPLDLTVLHRQHMLHLHPMVAQVRPSSGE